MLPAEFVNQLKKMIVGELRTDLATRKLYSTDGSIYQIEPLGVVFPRVADDLPAIVQLAADHKIPILPRGSGSSLAGQAIGPALIIDCSRHLNRLIEINPEEYTATVEPGLILTGLNRAVAKIGLQFGPDPASADRASMGGCVGNNAAGAHSIVYGMVVDHLQSAEVVLSDGSLAKFETQSLDAAERLSNQHSRLGDFYRAALKIRTDYSAAIHQNWPQTWRRVSGYNLNYLLPWSPSQPPQWAEGGLPYPPIQPGTLNLAHLLAGSEGTLAVLRQIQVRLVHRPRYTILGVVSYPGIVEACEAVPDLLNLNPSAIELIPQSLIRLARSVPAYAHQLTFVEGDPAALLVVEFSADEPALLRKHIGVLKSQIASNCLVAETEDQQKQVWAVRKVGLGILMSLPGDAKPAAFIEDLAVPVEQLGQFVREMEKLLAAHGTTADYYAHASAGCLHIRPLLNLKTTQGKTQLRAIAEEAVTLVQGLGGAVSAEHGDGLARGEWIDRAYGPDIARAIRELKQAADPVGLLNPGKIVGCPPMDANLRYGDDYHPQGWIPRLNFSNGLVGAVEQCNGAGVCRKSEGTMCPSFQATQEEMHSTRGRANLLRAMLSRQFPTEQVATQAVREALDLCLACKGCKAECPSAVDMAKLKYEFLAQSYSRGGGRRPWRDYLFGYIGVLAKLGHRLAPLANRVLASKWIGRVGERYLGLSARRQLPSLAPRSLSAQSASLVVTAQKASCLFLSDAFNEYFYPQIGMDALQVLKQAGCSAAIIPVIGAGRTLISKGFLDTAKRHAAQLIRTVAQLDPAGVLPIVGVEPSEIYTLRDEFIDLFPGDPQVRALAERSYMIDEFLLRPAQNGRRPIDTLTERSKSAPAQQPAVLFHAHCYQKAQPPAADGLPSGAAATVALLEAFGYRVKTISDGCCGMAGAFGYEAEHYDLSMRVGEQTLFPAVRAALQANKEMIIATAGVSCQAQIEDGTKAAPIHPITLVARRLAAG